MQTFVIDKNLEKQRKLENDGIGAVTVWKQKRNKDKEQIRERERERKQLSRSSNFAIYR